MKRREVRAAVDVVELGRSLAVAQGIEDARSDDAWRAYGQACQDALIHGRPVPRPLDATRRGADRVGSDTSVGVPTAFPAGIPAGTYTGAPTGRSTAIPAGFPGAAASEERASTPLRRHLAIRLVWGLAWRYGILAAMLVYAESRATTPWLAVLGVLVAGIVLGLWHRSWPLARLWRTVVVAGTVVVVGPIVPAAYPDVIVGSLGALTAAPVVATWRRRGGRR